MQYFVKPTQWLKKNLIKDLSTSNPWLMTVAGWTWRWWWINWFLRVLLLNTAVRAQMICQPMWRRPSSGQGSLFPSVTESSTWEPGKDCGCVNTGTPQERELLLWQWMVVLCDDLPSNGADIYSYRGISVVGHRQTFCKECWHRICDIVIVQCLWYQDGVEYKIYISGFSSLKHS